MKLFKKHSIIIYVLFIIFFVSSIFYFKNNKKPIPNSNVMKMTQFLKVYGDFSSEENEKYILNFYYFYSGEDELSSGIERIEFNDINYIEVTSFKILNSVNIDEYTLKSVPLEVKFTKQGPYQIKELNIIDKLGNKHTFNIGNLNITVGEKNSIGDISLGDKYPVIRDSFNSYIYSLNNNTNSEIIISNIDFNSDNLKYNFEKKTIKPNSNINEEIKFDFSGSEYDYYILRPKIEYQLGLEKKYFYPTLTYYDINSITKSKLEKSQPYK